MQEATFLSQESRDAYMANRYPELLPKLKSAFQHCKNLEWQDAGIAANAMAYTLEEAALDSIPNRLLERMADAILLVENRNQCGNFFLWVEYDLHKEPGYYTAQAASLHEEAGKVVDYLLDDLENGRVDDRYKPEDSGWMLSTMHTVRTFLNYLSDSLEGSNVSWIEYRLLVEMAYQLDILGEGSMCDYRCLADVVKDIPAWYWDR